MLSLIVALVVSATPSLSFKRPEPKITQHYNGSYSQVTSAMNWDFSNGRYPGLATYTNSYDLYDRDPYIKITLVEKLPNWLDKRKYPKEAPRWDAMYKIMHEHEQIHLDIYEEAIKRGWSKMVDKHPDEMNTILQAALIEAAEINRIYDSLSDHSRKQDKFRKLPGTFKDKYDTLHKYWGREIADGVRYRY